MYAEAGANLAFRDADKGTLLHAAVLQGSLEIVQYLSTVVGVVAVQHVLLDGDGATALHLACSLGHVQIVR